MSDFFFFFFVIWKTDLEQSADQCPNAAAPTDRLNDPKMYYENSLT